MFIIVSSKIFLMIFVKYSLSTFCSIDICDNRVYLHIFSPIDSIICARHRHQVITGMFKIDKISKHSVSFFKMQFSSIFMYFNTHQVDFCLFSIFIGLIWIIICLIGTQWQKYGILFCRIAVFGVIFIVLFVLFRGSN